MTILSKVWTPGETQVEAFIVDAVGRIVSGLNPLLPAASERIMRPSVTASRKGLVMTLPTTMISQDEKLRSWLHACS